MDWKQAAAQIRRAVKAGARLDPDSPYRCVISTDFVAHSKRYGYKAEAAFVVTIGKSNRVRIPWSMLEQCFNALKSPEGYSGRFFQNRFSRQYSDHPCHVHVVGMIFKTAGLADMIGKSYRARSS